MSLLSWLSQKPSAKPLLDDESSGLGQMGATVPFPLSDHGKTKMPAISVTNVARKTERLERREQLYSVVREAMIRVGVLSSKYKFKVLSLDSRGSKYLIMMDLAKSQAADGEKLVEMEGLIAKTAKAQHDILVTAVYWRLNENAADSVLSRRAEDSPSAARNTLISALIPPQPERRRPRGEPALAEELAAYKQAMLSGQVPQKLASPGQIVRSSGATSTSHPDFADTEFLDEAQMPLSGTQYGDLN